MFGPVVLYGWPVVVVILFCACSRPVALLATVIAGYLFLPTQISFNLPGLPTLDKDTIPAITAFFAVLMMNALGKQEALPGWIPRGALPKALVIVILGAAFLTVMTNRDPLVYGPTFLPAMRPWDGFSAILTRLTFLLPFFLGRKLLAHPDQQRLVLTALVIAGAVYSFLALYEIRMSPQLNNTIYGVFQHSWLQHIRGGGFRPLVFLQHGLWLAIFFSATILAAFGLMRIVAPNRKLLYLGVGLFLLVTLILSKSLGALIITLVLLPVIFFLRPSGQLKVAAVFAIIVLVYPMLRGGGLIPVDTIMGWVDGFSTDRSGSLGFRLRNEDLLLEKAEQRSLFGWGGWGRNFVFNETGETISSVADGYWILIIGQGGWVRYLTEFGLLCMPVILLAWRAQKYELALGTSVLAVILTGNLVDLIPNATITPLTWMIAGALWGRLELGRITEAEESAPQAAPQSRWTRAQLPASDPASVRQTDDPAKPKPVHRRYTRQPTRIDRSSKDPR